MKKLVSLFFISILISCIDKKKNDLELEILNDTLVAFSYDLKKDTINILNYCIVNNSDKIYYFNQGYGNKFLDRKVYKNGLYLSIFDTSTNKEVIYSDKLPFEHQNKSTCDSCNNLIQSTRFKKEIERLGENDKLSYYMIKDKRHYFFIYPKQKLFFKQYINLTDSMRYEDTRFNYAHLKKNMKYSSKLFISSDSANYKNILPNDILKTIEVNKVKVFDGILESKNRVPIKVLE